MTDITTPSTRLRAHPEDFMNLDAYNRIVIGDNSTCPLIEIGHSAGFSQGGVPAAALDARSRDFLQATVRSAIEVAKAAHFAHSDFYILTFSPETLMDLGSHTLQQVPSGDGIRGWIVNAKSHVIHEHGVLQGANFANAAVVAGAVLQILATVTLQAYLHEINGQLASLRRDVEGIRQFLKQEREGRVYSNLDYLERKAALLESGPLTPVEAATVLHQLESIDRESGATAHHLKQQIATGLAHLDGVTAPPLPSSMWASGSGRKSLNASTSSKVKPEFGSSYWKLASSPSTRSGCWGLEPPE